MKLWIDDCRPAPEDWAFQEQKIDEIITEEREM